MSSDKRTLLFAGIIAILISIGIYMFFSISRHDDNLRAKEINSSVAKIEAVSGNSRSSKITLADGTELLVGLESGFVDAGDLVTKKTGEEFFTIHRRSGTPILIGINGVVQKNP